MWIELTISFGFGAFGWSLTEYLLHRFVGHRKSSQMRFSVEHKRHHAKSGYFTSSRTKCLLASRVLIPMWLLISVALGWALGLAITAGFTLAYVGYEWVHYSLHAYPPSTVWGRWLRKHHFAHHYHNPNRNHGVTSPIWDWVFGTLVPNTKVRVPHAFVDKSMPWLIHPETGEIKDVFRKDYSIKKRIKNG